MQQSKFVFPAISVAALTFCGDLAQAQLKLEFDQLKIDRKLFELPERSPYQIPAERAPVDLGIRPIGPTMAPAPPGFPSVTQPPESLTVPVRSLVDPVVASDTIGIFNLSTQTLGVTLKDSGGAIQTLKLTPRQLVLQQYKDGMKVTGQTSDTSAPMSLDMGSIYFVTTDGKAWLLKKL